MYYNHLVNSEEMKFAIIGNTYQPKKSGHIDKLFEILQKYNAEILICKRFYQFLNQEKREWDFDVTLFENNSFDADIVISVGGDGTFLQAASRVGDKNIPILGINTGRLGFLADTTPNEIEEVLSEIHSHQYTIEERSVLHLKGVGKQSFEAFALNDIAILKRDTSSMISIHTMVDKHYLTTYQADGLVIATPTGSTAYSLSVGGPVLVPQAKDIVITPVAPHSLNVRPIVISDTSSITLNIESRNHNFLVAIDGRSKALDENTQLHISKANYTIKVVQRIGHVFFNTLQNKLMWGVDKRRTSSR